MNEPIGFVLSAIIPGPIASDEHLVRRSGEIATVLVGALKGEPDATRHRPVNVQWVDLRGIDRSPARFGIGRAGRAEPGKDRVAVRTLSANPPLLDCRARFHIRPKPVPERRHATIRMLADPKSGQ